jgi:hypothetical protein
VAIVAHNMFVYSRQRACILVQTGWLDWHPVARHCYNTTRARLDLSLTVPLANLACAKCRAWAAELAHDADESPARLRG